MRVTGPCAEGTDRAGGHPDGTVTCRIDQDTQATYDGEDFAISNQACPPGQVIRGFNELGEMLCVQDDNTQNFYSGLDFALSDQQCGANKKVVGIDVEGRIVCSNLEDSVYLAGAGLQLDVETSASLPVASKRRWSQMTPLRLRRWTPDPFRHG